MPSATDGDGPDQGMRAKMVAALAEFLEIDYERASDALHHIWFETKDVQGGGSIAYTIPNLGNPGHALAYRVEMALRKEFDGEEEAFPAIVLVQARDGHIAMAAIHVPVEDAERMMRLGIGAVRRNLRQQGAEE